MADRKITVTACGLCLVFVKETTSTEPGQAVFGLLDGVRNHVPTLLVDGVDKTDYISGRAKLHVERAGGRTNTITAFHEANFPLPNPPLNHDKMDFRYLIDIKQNLYGGKELRFDSAKLVRRLSLDTGEFYAGHIYDKRNSGQAGDGNPDEVKFLVAENNPDDPVVDPDSDPVSEVPKHTGYVAEQVLVEITLTDGDTAEIRHPNHPNHPPIPLAGNHRIELRNGCFDDPVPPGHQDIDFRFFYKIVLNRRRVLPIFPGGLGGQMCIPGGGGDKPPQP